MSTLKASFSSLTITPTVCGLRNTHTLQSLLYPSYAHSGCPPLFYSSLPLFKLIILPPLLLTPHLPSSLPPSLPSWFFHSSIYYPSLLSLLPSSIFPPLSLPNSFPPPLPHSPPNSLQLDHVFQLILSRGIPPSLPLSLLPSPSPSLTP